MARVVEDPTYDFFTIINLLFKADADELSVLSSLIILEKDLYSFKDYVALLHVSRAAQQRMMTIQDEKERAELHDKMKKPEQTENK